MQHCKHGKQKFKLKNRKKKNNPILFWNSRFMLHFYVISVMLLMLAQVK